MKYMLPLTLFVYAKKCACTFAKCGFEFGLEKGLIVRQLFNKKIIRFLINKSHDGFHYDF